MTEFGWVRGERDWETIAAKNKVRADAAEKERDRLRTDNAAKDARIAELGAAGNRLGDAAIAGILDGRDRAERAEEQAHYANGVADLAMKHRNSAEAELKAMRETVRKIRATDNITAVWHIADAALNPPD